MATVTSIFDYYLEPITSMWTREMAESLVKRPPDPSLVARVAELGRKADDGTLSESERDEYKCLVDAGDLIALLKTKARQFLDDHPA